MSDGTLKLFAYYLLLHEKNPRQLVFIEEPENGLYHHYLAKLAEEMKKSVGNGYMKQLFVTTHSPFFVNALVPDDVWVLSKDASGFSTVKRASEYDFVQELSQEGVELGDMWYMSIFRIRSSFMYVQFLIEDKSTEKLVCHVMDKLKICYSDKDIDYDTKAFGGIGHLPKKGTAMERKTGQLLNDLPMFLRAFDKKLRNLPGAVIIVVLDNDKKRSS